MVVSEGARALGVDCFFGPADLSFSAFTLLDSVCSTHVGSFSSCVESIGRSWWISCFFGVRFASSGQTNIRYPENANTAIH